MTRPAIAGPWKNDLERGLLDHVIGGQHPMRADDRAGAVALGMLDQHRGLVQRIERRARRRAAGAEDYGKHSAHQQAHGTARRHDIPPARTLLRLRFR